MDQFYSLGLDFLFFIAFFCIYLVFQLLDFLLGHRHEALFRRAELKTLVNMHGNEVCMRVTWCFGLKQRHASTLHKYICSSTLEDFFLCFILLFHQCYLFISSVNNVTECFYSSVVVIYFRLLHLDTNVS